MSWTCDSCGREIESVEDGWVEWRSYLSKERQDDGFRLVHHRRIDKQCAYDEDKLFAEGAILADGALEWYLSTNGLMMLLSYIHDDSIKKDEVVEMIKRLHIEGYEQARLHFNEAIQEGIFEPNTPPNFYWKEDIDATLRYLEKRVNE
ncbi:hypothetical protein JKJ11_15135 [Vibrio sp. SCSIO 43133]|uniref:hypothetical protein n=1 Tax=Vibrio sp. SCSIO 43133 TaxID=2802577 RepID=UPI00207628C6|nr:hypothetical protein [Vibrio sp. SCSIO 43133]USE00240.1 hypothetical protein JKJ11_15135 [Vibrio sp. SCSIO 43133]